MFIRDMDCTEKKIGVRGLLMKCMTTVEYQINNIPDNTSIKVFDIQGLLVQDRMVKSAVQKLSLDYLPIGVYIIVAERTCH